MSNIYPPKKYIYISINKTCQLPSYMLKIIFPTQVKTKENWKLSSLFIGRLMKCIKAKKLLNLLKSTY